MLFQFDTYRNLACPRRDVVWLPVLSLPSTWAVLTVVAAAHPARSAELAANML